MVYLTGDIHGDPQRIVEFCATYGITAEDVIVLLGDVGVNYFADERDWGNKSTLAELLPTFLCIHGNHERRPEKITSYKEKIWNGGIVLYESKYPNLLFAKDGEIFELAGKKCITIGGAYSVDKYYRLARRAAWWEDEQPSDEIKNYVEKKLHENENKVDYVFAHTCPTTYIPREAFLQGVDQSTVDRTTEDWLDKITKNMSYKKWFCGHWHLDKRDENIIFLFKGFDCVDENLYGE